MGGCITRNENAIFLKSTNECYDINTHGAYSTFMIAKSKSETPERVAKFETIQLYNSKTREWDDVDKDLLRKLTTWAKTHDVAQPDDTTQTDSDADEAAESYVMTSEGVHTIRDRLKVDAGDQEIMLISMVVTDMNIDGWIQRQKEYQSNGKMVKATLKESSTSDGIWKCYTRMVAKSPAAMSLAGITSGGRPSINLQNSLLEVSTNNDYHIAITKDYAMRVNAKTGETEEGSLKAPQYAQISEQFMRGRSGDSSAMEDLHKSLDEVCTNKKTLTPSEAATTDRFVCLLGNSKDSVQLHSALNDNIQSKIQECKSLIPTTISTGSQVTKDRGSMFKYAKGVSLATASFQKGTVSTLPYE